MKCLENEGGSNGVLEHFLRGCAIEIHRLNRILMFSVTKIVEYSSAKMLHLRQDCKYSHLLCVKTYTRNKMLMISQVFYYICYDACSFMFRLHRLSARIVAFCHLAASWALCTRSPPVSIGSLVSSSKGWLCNIHPRIDLLKMELILRPRVGTLSDGLCFAWMKLQGRRTWRATSTHRWCLLLVLCFEAMWSCTCLMTSHPLVLSTS